MFKRLIAIACVLLALASPARASFFPSTTTGCTGSTAIVTLTAATSATLLAAGSYKVVEFMVVGANPMTVIGGIGTAVAGQGLIYSAGQGAGFQGASESYNGPAVPNNGLSAISTAGTTVALYICQ